jgi:hypothetical protein
VAVADDVEGENSGYVGKGASSSVPELHMGSADIRSRLIGDQKHMSESTPVSAEVTRGMCSGGRSSCPIVMKPEAKEAHQCEH